MDPLRIGLIGDFDPAVTAHRAIPQALGLVAEALGMTRPLAFAWLATDAIPAESDLARFDGLWCVPASPYRNAEAALRAIRFARERGVPFLGTCGGFQHAIVEYARGVLGWADAGHAETVSSAKRAVIAPLASALVETDATVRSAEASRIASAYGRRTVVASYHCSYGLATAFTDDLLAGDLRPTAFDARGQVRAVELDSHPFFVCTLFQPEREALRGAPPPRVKAFVTAAQGV